MADINQLEIANVAAQLAQAIETIHNPSISQELRNEAYTACEDFKEKYPLNVIIACSVYLTQHGSHIVRRFGLQLLENCVKFKWYDINQYEKISIKDITMTLMQSSDNDFAEHKHLRTALCRVIVEMIKREWPQNWSDLLPSLFQIAGEGHVQANIVVHTFLTLFEDIVVFQNLEFQQRRKDLTNHLSLNLELILAFMLSVIEKHFNIRVEKGVDVINSTLQLISELIEFTTVTKIFNERRLIPVLCRLMEEKDYQKEAVGCLDRIAQKRGKVDRKNTCIMLLNSEVIETITRLNFDLSNGLLDEKSYLFIENVSLLLFSMCTLISDVIKNEPQDADRFKTCTVFDRYLEILIILCAHPSMKITLNINRCWISIFENPVLQKHSTVLQYVQKWISVNTPRLLKIQYQANDIPLFQETYKFFIYDFEDEDAFDTFFHKFHFTVSDGFRKVTAIAPQATFTSFDQWLTNLIQKTDQSVIYHRYSMVYLEWEAVSSTFESVIQNIPQNMQISFERPFSLLNLLFDLQPSDLKIASFSLSCISALMPFIHKAPNNVSENYVAKLLEKIFACLATEYPTNASLAQIKDYRNMRHHVCAHLLKQSQKYTSLFLPYFDHIMNLVAEFRQIPGRLSHGETTLLLECIIQISTGYKNYDRQSMVISNILSTIKTFWSGLLRDVFTDYSKFIAFIGLDEFSKFDSTKNFRNELLHSINLLLGVLKRSSCPAIREEALKGGFILTVNAPISNTADIYKNPIADHIMEFVPGIFCLIKVVHQSWTPGAKSELSKEYEEINSLSKLEVKSLLGVHISAREAEVLESMETNFNVKGMRQYINMVYDTCYSILSAICQNVGRPFYELPDLQQNFVHSIFYQLHSVPDQRLRSMIHIFFKSFVRYCPTNKHEDVLIPILLPFVNYMYERLAAKWKYLQECRDKGIYHENEEGSNESNKELIEHHVTIHISREYMDLVRVMLMKPSSDTKLYNGPPGEESQSPTGSQNNLSIAANECLSELGIKLLQCDETRNGLMNFILNTVCGVDSTNSLKATCMIPTIVRQLSNDGRLTPDMARYILISSLNGLQIHGQHESNKGPLLNNAVFTYQTLGASQPLLIDVLLSIPEVNPNDVHKFDQKIANLPVLNTCKVDKSTREMFRKLVSSLIGQNIGQLFKMKEAIRDLPKITIPRPKGENVLDSSGGDNIGFSNFFTLAS